MTESRGGGGGGGGLAGEKPITCDATSSYQLKSENRCECYRKEGGDEDNDAVDDETVGTEDGACVLGFFLKKCQGEKPSSSSVGASALKAPLGVPGTTSGIRASVTFGVKTNKGGRFWTNTARHYIRTPSFSTETVAV
ncbi:hypothetical protein EYF80_034120 [Liparis tanakae]|uniref:Uncharacterized protein n=1 Tax=Liparis tanakae TaxID=230148 RepID=A0A4Z2GRE2_9TELE|nr:hypothetical protein EYF80_034120 [Liparis tanakae]